MDGVVTADPNPVAVGSNVDLTANVDDTSTGGSNIASAEYSVDDGEVLVYDNAFAQPSGSIVSHTR